MAEQQLHAVIGAFGFTGKYITRRLLAKGHRVITLTNSPHRANPFEDKVRAYPFHFDNPDKLAENLRGVSVLYNTYWVRFNHPLFTHANAVENVRVLFESARKAGVKRIVHISITNPSKDSPLEYFSGKAKMEEALLASGVPYSILRPPVLFGDEDILINNIAWLLRRVPVFAVFGGGKYRLQPIYVDDLAELAVREGENNKNVIIDAIGPETFAYRALVEEIGEIIGKKRPIIPVFPVIGYLAGSLLGKLLNDVFITRAEIEGLMADLLYVDSPPAGKTRLTDWVKQHADSIGTRYASELARRIDKTTKYPGYAEET
ncbi:MAG: NAD(P)H-binding protein [Gammaproteobacteria bacterium]|nr:NAD(P)H-binding protein [Gammaproteobacteria bacterium]